MAYENLRKKCEAKYGSINKMAKELGIAAQDLYSAFAGKKPFYPKWYDAVVSAINDAPPISVYQEIKQMDKKNLAKWIVKLLNENDRFTDEICCRMLCKYRVDGHCSVPDEYYCLNKLSQEEIILKWLDSEVK